MQYMTTFATSGPRPSPVRRAIGVWLLVCCAAVFTMVVLGGVTRLTRSGLSMVEWQPLSILPPLNTAQWQETFAKYQQFPEYHLRNAGMTLAEFKGIFWLEYIHRLWGRTIGLIFFVPFAWFVVRRAIDRPLGLRLAGIFLLGGMQGLMGWLMVKSGLVDRPEVSQYRLTAHLALAVLVYGAMLWVGLDLLAPRQPRSGAAAVDGLRRGALALVGLVFLTMMSGGFVAGLKAGLGYNTFPLMNGEFIPDGVMAMTPVLVNFFENPATVQFDHRMLAETTGILIIAMWLWRRRAAPAGRVRLALDAFGIMAVVQLGLGIATLLLVVPVGLAATHQAGALVLLTLGIWLIHETMAYAQQRQDT
ncbi:MAG: COX15/CtaA family protein [Alphaproteobacteria bacterium]|nr:COX15/CtaA family protein [Alphaproteobacteria bacterium]